MNIYKLASIFVSTFMIIVISLFTTSAMGQSINLYSQPSSTAAVTGTADLSTGIIPILSSSDGQWLKAADPRNGNVGWVNVTDIKNAKGTTNTFTLQQDMLSTGSKPVNYQVIQSGTPKVLTSDQLKTFMNTMHNEQQNLQNSFMNIFNGFNDLLQYQWNTWVQQSNTPTPQTNASSVQPAPAASQTGTGSTTNLNSPSTGSIANPQ